MFPIFTSPEIQRSIFIIFILTSRYHVTYKSYVPVHRAQFLRCVHVINTYDESDQGEHSSYGITRKYNVTGKII